MLKVPAAKLRLFEESLKDTTIPPIGMRHTKKWFPVSRISTPEFTVEGYNTRGQLRKLELEAWICLDRDEDGNHSLLPMLIDNHGKEKSGTGTAVNGTHPDFRMGHMPDFFVFFYGGTKIVLRLKERE